jgi:hypothetical protein
MSRIALRFTVPALAFLALVMPGRAWADVHIGVGFGTVIGPRYPHHHWRGSWVLGPHWYWHDPWYDPWYDFGPVIVEPPVVVHRQVIVKEHRPPVPQPQEQLSERQQQRRSELLERLRIGDVSSRIQAVEDLGRFANDDKTRKALRDALLADRDARVRRAVAELFGRVKDTRTLPALKQAHTMDSDRDVRQAAYKAIILMEGY